MSSLDLLPFFEDDMDVSLYELIRRDVCTLALVSSRHDLLIENTYHHFQVQRIHYMKV